MQRMKTNEERFFEKVSASMGLCWLWTGSKDRDGYGIFMFRRDDGSFKKMQAHRYAYALLIGPIPEGKVLDHIKCDTPPCVNPWHTIPATNWENTKRGNAWPAINSRATHCAHGHELTPENIRFRKDRFGRQCRACERKHDLGRKR